MEKINGFSKQKDGVQKLGELLFTIGNAETKVNTDAPIQKSLLFNENTLKVYYLLCSLFRNPSNTFKPSGRT